jgi:hypothetical protein
MQDVGKSVLYAARGFLRVAFRARRRYTGARRPKLLRFISQHGNTHRKQTRCAKLPFRNSRAASPQPVLFSEKLNRRSIFRLRNGRSFRVFASRVFAGNTGYWRCELPG